MGKKLVLAIALLMASFQVNAQACPCNGPVQSKTFAYASGQGTFTIFYIDCAPGLKIVDVKYIGLPAPFLLQDAMDMLLKDGSLTFDELMFDGECGGMVPGTTTAWGEGSGPHGTTAFNLVYCNSSTTCCRLSRQEATAAFVGIGITAPTCGTITNNLGNGFFSTTICYRICHPNN